MQTCRVYDWGDLVRQLEPAPTRFDQAEYIFADGHRRFFPRGADAFQRLESDRIRAEAERKNPKECHTCVSPNPLTLR
jgi:hypothetical protein